MSHSGSRFLEGSCSSVDSDVVVLCRLVLALGMEDLPRFSHRHLEATAVALLLLGFLLQWDLVFLSHRHRCDSRRSADVGLPAAIGLAILSHRHLEATAVTLLLLGLSAAVGLSHLQPSTSGGDSCHSAALGALCCSWT